MARAIWSGSLQFGLVNVDVGLFSATEQKDVSFHQFEEGTNQRVRYKRVAEGTDRQVDYDDVVKGYQVGSDDYVMLTKEELEAAEPGKSRAIEIEDFVELPEIDPIYYEKSYYLAPRRQESNQAYALLRDAMRQADLAGVASFVMRSKQYLAVIRPWKNVLVLETLFFADEVRDPEQTLGDLPGTTRSDSRELKSAVQLIAQLQVDWEPERYRDDYRERLLEMVRQKAEGEQVHVEKAEPSGAEVSNLMDALQRSIEQAGGQRQGRKKTGTARKSSQKSQASSRAGDDLSELSKSRLYERAGELEISGRSKMSRDQLEAAVRKAAS